MAAIALCRTATLGGHVETCDDCALSRVAYNPVATATAPNARLPRAIAGSPTVRPICCRCRTSMSSSPCRPRSPRSPIRTSGSSIRSCSRRPPRRSRPLPPIKHLGGELGFLAILHTWGETLTHHPHLHCLVPGGVLAADGGRWIACRRRFFLPVRVLSRLFRRLFLERLLAAQAAEACASSAPLNRLATATPWLGRCVRCARSSSV